MPNLPTQSPLFWNTFTSLIEISALPLTYSKIPLHTFWTSTSLVMALASTEKILLPDSTLILKVLSLGDTSSWVRALIDRVHRICTPNKIKTELKLIRTFLSWNGFPKRIANLLIDRFTTNAQNRAPDHNTNDTSRNNQHSTIWLTIPFVGDLTTQLVKKLKRKLRRCLIDPNVDIRIKQKTTKLCFFTSNKDKTPPLSRSNVVYEFTCPGCNSSYIGKTNRTAACPHTRTCAHGQRKRYI